jgi:hypothetical protein
MRVVEYDPGMVMLTSIRGLAHGEPANALRQHQHRRQRGISHRLGDALSRNPL